MHTDILPRVQAISWLGTTQAAVLAALSPLTGSTQGAICLMTPHPAISLDREIWVMQPGPLQRLFLRPVRLADLEAAGIGAVDACVILTAAEVLADQADSDGFDVLYEPGAYALPPATFLVQQPELETRSIRLDVTAAADLQPGDRLHAAHRMVVEDPTRSAAGLVHRSTYWVRDGWHTCH